MPCTHFPPNMSSMINSAGHNPLADMGTTRKDLVTQECAFYGMGTARHMCHSLAIAVAGYSFPKYSSPATSHSTNPYLLIFDIL